MVMGSGSHFCVVAAVFVWWWLLVIVLGGHSHFWAVVFDHGPLGWVDIGHHWSSCFGYRCGVVEVVSSRWW